ncbi:MAG: WD40/YVTN/BNR-like repeat-containing protein [Holophagaceae bacterium]
MYKLTQKFSATSLIYALVASCLALVPIIVSAESSSAATLETIRFPRNKVASIYINARQEPMSCYQSSGTCGGTKTSQNEYSLPAGGHFKVFAYPNPNYRAGLSVCNSSDSCQNYGDGNIYAYKANEYFLLRFRAPAPLGGAPGPDHLLVFSLGSADPYLLSNGSSISWTFNSSNGREGAYNAAPSSASAAISGQVQAGSTLTGIDTYTGVDVEITRQWKRSDYYRPLSNVGGANIPGATGSTYTLTEADVGKYIRYSIQLRNMQGSASAFGVGSDYALVAAAPRLALNSTFGATTSTYGGLTVNVTNYDATFTYGATVTGGSVSVGVASGTNLPLTVTGLSSAQNVQVTVTTTKSGFPNGTGTVAGVSLESAITSTTGPIGRWVASSIAKQSKTLLVANQGGYLYTSTDNGLNWVQRASIQNWSTVAQSDNGTTMIAAVAGSYMYKSIDSGATWNVVAPERNWRSVACSSDCSVILGAEANGKLYRSIDSGGTWLQMESTRNWRSVSISANGNTMLALPHDGQPYISVNRGINWSTGSTNFVNPNWTSAAVSADGSKIFAAPFMGWIAYSENSGSTWSQYMVPISTTAIGHAGTVNKLMHCGNDGVVTLGSGVGISVESVAANPTPWVSCSISADGNVLLATSTTGLLSTSTNGGTNWTVRSINSGNVKRRAIVATESGNEIYSAVYGGKIEYSSNGGVTWSTAFDLTGNWIGICASTSLNKIYAVAYQGFIYQSMDSGATWNKVEFRNLSWVGIACSADGSTAVAVAKGGNIYNTTDSGTNWTPRDEKRKWVGVALSSNGTKAAVVVEGGFVYTSSNSGDNWTQRGSSRNWSAIASSGNGNKLVATVAKGKIYVSSNSGESWSAKESNRNWLNVVSSTSGNKLIAVVGTGRIYTSSDSGSAWKAQESARNWRGLFVAGNGNRAFAADFGRKLYSSTDSGETWTAL